MLHNPGFHSLRYLAQGCIKGVGNLPQSAHRWVKNASFDSTDVCPVEPALAAEALLRVACHFAKFAHDGTYGSCPQVGRLNLPLAPLHRQIRW